MEGVRDREGKEGTGVERVRDRGRRVQMWRERDRRRAQMWRE